jgi:hypothetical protein
VPLQELLRNSGGATPNHLMAADSGNARGYFESVPFMNFHDELLASAGSYWHDWRKFNPSGSNLTVESVLGFPPVEARAILRDAHRKIHLHFADRSAAAQSSHQRSQRSAEARLAG